VSPTATAAAKIARTAVRTAKLALAATARSEAASATVPSVFGPKKEISVKKALLSPDADLHLRPAINKEMTKLTTQYQAIEEIAARDIPANAVRLRSKMFVIWKRDAAGKVTRANARLACGGNDQPRDSYRETYAPTVDESTTKVAIAAFHADAVKNNYVRELCMSDFDVPGAFLNIELDKTSCPRPIVMKIQEDLPHPLAGKWVLIKKGVYGLKQSNNLFELDIRKQFHKAGFLPLESDPCLYMKVNLLDPSKKWFVSMHVDDGQAIYNDRSLYDDLIGVLEQRYGALTHNPVTSSFLGQGIHRSDKGGVTFTMEGYISGLCQKFGLSPTDKASSPSDKDLFQDTSYMPAVDVTLYQKVIGGLIYVLKNRSDVRKEVIFLATKTANPNMGDLIKCIRVLKYLNTTRTLGPTYYTDEGVVLYGCVDAAYGVHAYRRSQTG